ncbi:Peptidase M23 [Alicyclobacillus hesperidum URH17-3-68]|uniref:Peptidase family M23 n=1 Tax=Alicyclobacillus hesperidum TaxID=89784 RepID=A0A1H2T7H3_9BACL|nr:M23 family metallopeptidase [Alicyclobacillus hesperidum]EJY55955.1 Peptidase M23 [Alicyclobacillus hesperidum URH17-3-68]GLV13792.1 hypothetical protein Heshes_14760 [Alicyclobacillus hesperidum]SDW39906.1 Peptidase family M23 [Alicyclobacillus hesperidum]
MARVKRKWPWQSPSRLKHEHWANGALPRDGSGPVKTDASEPAPRRWIVDADEDKSLQKQPVSPPVSPYGFADDDGGMRQVESEIWRRPPMGSMKQSRGRSFVPATGAGPRARFGANWAWQLLGAVVLVAVGYTIQHDPRIPASVAARAVSVFDTDYTSSVQPSIDRVFAKLHLRPPSLEAVSGPMHAPVFGSIVADYGPDHPEVWIAGDAGDVVQAAASGTVLTVVKSSGSYLIKIDHGVLGTAVYSGLASASVQPDEFVSAGEAIGRLPSTPTHPVFRFSLVKDGKYENPHQYISFPGASS